MLFFYLFGRGSKISWRKKNKSMLSSQLLGLVIAVYIVVRQFMERPVTPASLLISPALITLYTCFSIAEEWAKSPVSTAWLLMMMAAGLLAGGLLGVYRGNLATIRYNPDWRRVTVKASAVNIVLYLLVLAVRIAAEILLSLHLNERSALLALTMAFLTTLFLANIVLEKINWYLRARNYRAELKSVRLKKLSQYE